MRRPFVVTLAAFASATAAAEPQSAGTAQVLCGTDHIVVQSNRAPLGNVLTQLSNCLGFDLSGINKLDTAILRIPETSGSPNEVLQQILEGVNVLIVGDQLRIERVMILSADQGFLPPTENPGSMQSDAPQTTDQPPPRHASDDRGIDLTRIAPEVDNADISTEPAEPRSTLSDTMQRRALAATNAADTVAATEDSTDLSNSTDPQDYLPELTRQSQEQLKALMDALDRASTP